LEYITRLLAKVLYKLWNNHSLDGIAIVATMRDEDGQTMILVVSEGNEYTVKAMLEDAANGEGIYEPDTTD